MRSKLIWKSLKTDRISVAKLRQGDFYEEERQRAAAQTAVARGEITFTDALQSYRERLNSDQSLKERRKTYWEERITALLKSWPDLKQMDVVAQISKAGGWRGLGSAIRQNRDSIGFRQYHWNIQIGFGHRG